MKKVNKKEILENQRDKTFLDFNYNALISHINELIDEVNTFNLPVQNKILLQNITGQRKTGYIIYQDGYKFVTPPIQVSDRPDLEKILLHKITGDCLTERCINKDKKHIAEKQIKAPHLENNIIKNRHLKISSIQPAHFGGNFLLDTNKNRRLLAQKLKDYSIPFYKIKAEDFKKEAKKHTQQTPSTQRLFWTLEDRRELPIHIKEEGDFIYVRFEVFLEADYEENIEAVEGELFRFVWAQKNIKRSVFIKENIFISQYFYKFLQQNIVKEKVKIHFITDNILGSEEDYVLVKGDNPTIKINNKIFTLTNVECSIICTFSDTNEDLGKKIIPVEEKKEYSEEINTDVHARQYEQQSIASNADVIRQQYQERQEQHDNNQQSSQQMLFQSPNRDFEGQIFINRERSFSDNVYSQTEAGQVSILSRENEIRFNILNERRYDNNENQQISGQQSLSISHHDWGQQRIDITDNSINYQQGQDQEPIRIPLVKREYTTRNNVLYEIKEEESNKEVSISDYKDDKKEEKQTKTVITNNKQGSGWKKITIEEVSAHQSEEKNSISQKQLSITVENQFGSNLISSYEEEKKEIENSNLQESFLHLLQKNPDMVAMNESIKSFHDVSFLLLDEAPFEVEGQDRTVGLPDVLEQEDINEIQEIVQNMTVFTSLLHNRALIQEEHTPQQEHQIIPFSSLSGEEHLNNTAPIVINTERTKVVYNKALDQNFIKSEKKREVLYSNSTVQQQEKKVITNRIPFEIIENPVHNLTPEQSVVTSGLNLFPIKEEVKRNNSFYTNSAKTRILNNVLDIIVTRLEYGKLLLDYKIQQKEKEKLQQQMKENAEQQIALINQQKEQENKIQDENTEQALIAINQQQQNVIQQQKENIDNFSKEPEVKEEDLEQARIRHERAIENYAKIINTLETKRQQKSIGLIRQGAILGILAEVEKQRNTRAILQSRKSLIDNLRIQPTIKPPQETNIFLREQQKEEFQKDIIIPKPAVDWNSLKREMEKNIESVRQIEEDLKEEEKEREEQALQEQKRREQYEELERMQQELEGVAGYFDEPEKEQKEQKQQEEEQEVLGNILERKQKAMLFKNFDFQLQQERKELLKMQNELWQIKHAQDLAEINMDNEEYNKKQKEYETKNEIYKQKHKEYEERVNLIQDVQQQQKLRIVSERDAKNKEKREKFKNKIKVLIEENTRDQELQKELDNQDDGRGLEIPEIITDALEQEKKQKQEEEDRKTAQEISEKRKIQELRSLHRRIRAKPITYTINPQKQKQADEERTQLEKAYRAGYITEQTYQQAKKNWEKQFLIADPDYFDIVERLQKIEIERSEIKKQLALVKLSQDAQEALIKKDRKLERLRYDFLHSINKDQQYILNELIPTYLKHLNSSEKKDKADYELVLFLYSFAKQLNKNKTNVTFSMQGLIDLADQIDASTAENQYFLRFVRKYVDKLPSSANKTILVNILKNKIKDVHQLNIIKKRQEFEEAKKQADLERKKRREEFLQKQSKIQQLHDEIQAKRQQKQKEVEETIQELKNETNFLYREVKQDIINDTLKLPELKTEISNTLETPKSRELFKKGVEFLKIDKINQIKDATETADIFFEQENEINDLDIGNKIEDMSDKTLLKDQNQQIEKQVSDLIIAKRDIDRARSAVKEYAREVSKRTKALPKKKQELLFSPLVGIKRILASQDTDKKDAPPSFNKEDFIQKIKKNIDVAERLTKHLQKQAKDVKELWEKDKTTERAIKDYRETTKQVFGGFFRNSAFYIENDGTVTCQNPPVEVENNRKLVTPIELLNEKRDYANTNNPLYEPQNIAPVFRPFKSIKNLTKNKQNVFNPLLDFSDNTKIKEQNQLKYSSRGGEYKVVDYELKQNIIAQNNAKNKLHEVLDNIAEKYDKFYDINRPKTKQVPVVVEVQPELKKEEEKEKDAGRGIVPKKNISEEDEGVPVMVKLRAKPFITRENARPILIFGEEELSETIRENAEIMTNTIIFEVTEVRSIASPFPYTGDNLFISERQYLYNLTCGNIPNGEYQISIPMYPRIELPPATGGEGRARMSLEIQCSTEVFLGDATMRFIINWRNAIDTLEISEEEKNNVRSRLYEDTTMLENQFAEQLKQKLKEITLATPEYVQVFEKVLPEGTNFPMICANVLEMISVKGENYFPSLTDNQRTELVHLIYDTGYRLEQDLLYGITRFKHALHALGVLEQALTAYAKEQTLDVTVPARVNSARDKMIEIYEEGDYQEVATIFKSLSNFFEKRTRAVERLLQGIREENVNPNAVEEIARQEASRYARVEYEQTLAETKEQLQIPHLAGEKEKSFIPFSFNGLNNKGHLPLREDVGRPYLLSKPIVYYDFKNQESIIISGVNPQFDVATGKEPLYITGEYNKTCQDPEKRSIWDIGLPILGAGAGALGAKAIEANRGSELSSGEKTGLGIFGAVSGALISSALKKEPKLQILPFVKLIPNMDKTPAVRAGLLINNDIPKRDYEEIKNTTPTVLYDRPSKTNTFDYTVAESTPSQVFGLVNNGFQKTINLFKVNRETGNFAQYYTEEKDEKGNKKKYAVFSAIAIPRTEELITALEHEITILGVYYQKVVLPADYREEPNHVLRAELARRGENIEG